MQFVLAREKGNESRTATVLFNHHLSTFKKKNSSFLINVKEEEKHSIRILIFIKILLIFVLKISIFNL